MRRVLTALGLSVVLLAAACANDSTTPGGGRPDRNVGALSGGSCEPKPASEIEANLTLLMAYVVPNDNSTLGKFQQVKDAIALGDYALAQEKLNNLITFINLKYGQLSTAEQNEPITELDPDQTVSQFKDMVIADLICFISFDLNPGDPPKGFVNPEGTAGVWFPADYVPTGTNVEVTTIDPTTDPLVTPFDKYPTYVEIKLVPTPNPADLIGKGKPVVAVCFPTSGPYVPASDVAPRLLLGHQKVPNEASGFQMYEQVEVPSELATQLQCQGNLSISYSGVEKWLRKAAELILPQKLHAAFFGLGGVGGSPEEFSPFGAVDPGLTAVGGAGGSPEEFSKTAKAPAAKSGKPAPTVSSLVLPATYTSGQVGTEATTGLPSVTVQTDGGDADGVNPVPGVTVTFTLGISTQFDPDGNAHFCGAFPPTQVVVTTDASGVATLPCIDFGTVAGYSNLKATVDGSSLGYDDSLGNSLVIVVSEGSDPPSNEVNFLIQATAGAAAKFTLEQSPSSSAQAGIAFPQQPTLQLRDAHDNPVALAGVDVSAAIATGAGSIAGGSTVQTDGTGLATFATLRIDGLIGERTLSFTSSHPAVPGGTVTITPGPVAKLAMVSQPDGAQAGVAFTSQPSVRLEDAFGNDVATDGVAITAAIGTGDGTLLGDTEVPTTGGVAAFTDLRIDGVVGARTLAFSATGLTGVSSASLSVTPGDAASFVITTQPSATATAGTAFAQQPVLELRDAFNNATTTPAVEITATISTGGAGTLAGTLARTTVSGIATFTDLRIDGVVGSRTLDFNGGGLPTVTSSAVNVGAGSASSVRTYMPTASPVAAASYSYGTGLPVGPVSDPPQVLVTDAFGNAVGGVGVTWSPLTGSNGAALVVGAGATTTAAGLAQVGSWSLGDGLNQIIAEITGSGTPASFSATGPTGQVLFACSLGGSKADIGWLTFKTPGGTVRTISLWMSVTGQSSSVATYPANITLRKNGSTGLIVGSGSGGVTLPGNNGTATSVTFTLTDPAFVSETGGVGASNVLWVDVQFPGLPATRKIQVWYQNAKKLTTDCGNSLVYAPGSTTSSKKGLSISVTN